MEVAKEHEVDKARSQQMRLIRSKDTKPELKIRRALFALGYRYRLHPKNLPGKPDLTFPSRKKAIFIHGCFWHRHEGCKKNRTPKSKLEYWEPKFASNMARDQRNQEALTETDWRFMIVWECELKQLDQTIQRITDFLDEA